MGSETNAAFRELRKATVAANQERYRARMEWLRQWAERGTVTILKEGAGMVRLVRPAQMERREQVIDYWPGTGKARWTYRQGEPTHTRVGQRRLAELLDLEGRERR